MCQLINALDTVIREHPGLEPRLAYCWRGMDAEATDHQIADFHQRLTRAVRRRSPDLELIRGIIVEIIHTWGGISNYEGLADRYPRLLLELDEDHPVSTQAVTPISSWSKVLAAYDPERYNIYDSRVAAALRFLIPDTRWFLPVPHGANRQALFGHFGRRGQLSQADSYALYLDLLHETGDPLGSERRLFMFGGLLWFDEALQTVVLDIP